MKCAGAAFHRMHLRVFAWEWKVLKILVEDLNVRGTEAEGFVVALRLVAIQWRVQRILVVEWGMKCA